MSELTKDRIAHLIVWCSLVVWSSLNRPAWFTVAMIIAAGGLFPHSYED